MKPEVFILKFGSMEKLAAPRLPGALGLHILTGMVVYGNMAMIIDPGMACDFNEHVVEMKKQGIELSDVSHLLLTHLHQDHIQAIGRYLDGTQIFHQCASSILGTSEYGAKIYKDYIEIPEIRFEMIENAHSQKDMIYVIDSENEGKVAFLGDLVFGLFDFMPKEEQKKLDASSSINPQKRLQSAKDFLANHPEVEGFYLGHYNRKVGISELQEYLKEW